MGLADIHVHTIYSYDGTASLSAVLNRAKQIGLDVIAITDHDEIAGALKAMEMAPMYGVEVIPGIEITTAEGDLLAYFITEKVDAGLSLVETVLRVRALGGVCIAAHPMAGGMGMKSLSARSILKALRNPAVAETLIGIETYNATALDKMSNHYARILANRLNITQVGNSDAHVVEALGLGATEFEGNSAADLLSALKNGKTRIRKQKEWSAFRILGSWGMRYIESALVRRGTAVRA
ncbi:MAG: PHP domain-containing protein [Anaerolineales bacterium]|nr:PHP domain-containing protein [Anaerolineales bacterium]